MRRGDHRVFTTRYIAAHGFDRHIAMAEEDARQSFDLQILQAIALRLCEVADLGLCEMDILQIAGRNFRNRLLDFSV